MIPSKILSLFLLVTTVFARKKGFGPTNQRWGYVTVREGAHMFWWLHYTYASSTSTNHPLIIWLQGGPGVSSTYFGNFEELGPIDTNLKTRNFTWVNHANVLFVDNPVGTGFSYAESSNQLAKTNRQIAEDFLVLLQGFYKAVPKFKDVPLYIFSESYGGKMTAEIALVLFQAIEQRKIRSNFKGVGLGDSWISPVDSCLTWAPYLYSQGFLDTYQLKTNNKKALNLKALVDAEQWSLAFDAWEELEISIEKSAGNVDFYNVMNKIKSSYVDESFETRSLRLLGGKSDEEAEFMNNNVKKALKLKGYDWGVQGNLVFSTLKPDFMKPVTDVVERLLNETNLTVAVYSGQLDLIVDTLGTIKWVDKLQFRGSDKWTCSKKQAFKVDGIYEGFKKSMGNLAFYSVLRAGHMVPSDNPQGMLYILKDVCQI